MKNPDLLKKALIAAAIVGAIGLAGCEADGNNPDTGTPGGPPGDPGAIISDGGDDFPNDGTTRTLIDDLTVPRGVFGPKPLGGKFVCTRSAYDYGTPTTVVGANGLVGRGLEALLNSVGGDTLSALLASVSDPDNAVDGKLSTYATFTLTKGALGNLISSLDENILLDQAQPVPAGKFAVFGLTFPESILQLTVLEKVMVTTYLAGQKQEEKAIRRVDLDVLGLKVLKDGIFLGMKVSKPYDEVAIRLNGGLVSVDLGPAMYVRELCTDGDVVTAGATTP